MDFTPQTTCFSLKPEKMFSCFLLLVISSLSLLVSGSDPNCTGSLVLTPSSLVVRFGDPASVTCVVCKAQDVPVGFETSLGKVTPNFTTAYGHTIMWTVEKMTEWDISPICYYEDEGQHTAHLNVTVYEPPQRVSFSFLGHTETLERGEHTLQCSVSQVAPAERLAVTFYRGHTPLGHRKSTSTTKEPVSENFTLSYNISKEDDGAQFWCEARLDLGPEGPQPPPVVKSGTISPTVHYSPELLVPANPDPISITEGQTLHLNCSAEGKPAPSYTWTNPPGGANMSSKDNSVLTIDLVSFEHEGQYVCNVRNSMGSEEVTFTVKVQANIIPYIIAAAVVGVILGLVGAFMVYFFYYKPNRMGTYSLKDVFRLRTQHTAVPVKE